MKLTGETLCKNNALSSDKVVTVVAPSHTLRCFYPKLIQNKCVSVANSTDNDNFSVYILPNKYERD